jgi:arylsulfatase A
MILPANRAFCLALIAAILCGGLDYCSAQQSSSRPNIILVLDDDLGYGDLACYGCRDIQTPNLDRFATESVRLTSCYAGHPNCSPSRTALMTGRTPTRVGIRN